MPSPQTLSYQTNPHRPGLLPELAPDEVHVWLVPLSDDAARARAHWSLLSEDERRTALTFHQALHRRRYTLTRGHVRLLLADYLGTPPSGIAFAYGPFGKPALAGPARTLCFNVSHAADFALIAVARNMELGVDLEQIRDLPEREGVAAIYFSPAERAALDSVPPTARLAAFYRTWVRREALVKALGKGITLDPETPTPPGYTVVDLPAPTGYAAALALARQAAGISLWQLSLDA